MRAHTARTAALTTLAVALPGLVLTAVLLPGSAGAAGVECQGVTATVVGTEGADTLEGTKGDDVIASLGGDDVVYGRGGDDLVCGGYGSDRLFGGPGADQLYGGFDRYGDDPAGTYLVGDVLNGGEGDDRLAGVRDTRKVESHRRHEPMLLLAQQIAGPADLHIPNGEMIAAPQLRKFPQSFEARSGVAGQRNGRGIKEVAVGFLAFTSHAPPQLVKLG